jgi:hypothetical protein
MECVHLLPPLDPSSSPHHLRVGPANKSYVEGLTYVFAPQPASNRNHPKKQTPTTVKWVDVVCSFWVQKGLVRCTQSFRVSIAKI